MRKNILLAGLLCLTGCYRFHEATLSPEQTLNEFNQRALTDTGISPGSQGWGLDELTKAAFYYNDELKEMQAHFREAQGARTSAAERPNPTIGVKPGFNSSTPSGAGISPWILDFAVDLPIETMGKRAARTAQADFRLEAAKLKIASTAWTVRDNIRTALLELYAARQNVRILEQRRKWLQTELEQSKARLAAGDISVIDLKSVTMAFETGRNELAERQRQERKALSHLAQAAGLPVSALEGIRVDFSDFETQPGSLPAPEARRTALLNRADLLAALAEYNAAQMALKEEVSKQYPDVQIGPGYSFDQSDDKWSLGVSLNLPLFNRNQGAIKSAEAKRDAAAAVFLQRQESIAAEIDLAVRDYDAFAAQFRNSGKLQKQTAELEKTLRQMVRLGEVSELEAVQVELQYSRSQQEFLQTKISRLEALGRLENAMQHPAKPEDFPMNELLLNKGENK
jgi:outer membrane protein TolC